MRADGSGLAKRPQLTSGLYDPSAEAVSNVYPTYPTGSVIHFAGTGDGCRATWKVNGIMYPFTP